MRFSKMLSVVDCHAGGEIGQVITGGVGHIPGDTMFDKRVYLETQRDDIRKMVLFEPRGAPWHNANILLPSNHPDADMGYVIMESTEYPAMSGSNTMCVATVLLETGILTMVEPVTELTLEAPAGLIRVRCDCKDGKVTQVRFVNQPAFVYHHDQHIEVEGIGTVRVDVSYGGMTYVQVMADDLGFAIEPSEAREICEQGEKIKLAAAAQLRVEHPVNPAIPGISILSVMGKLRRENGQLIAKNTVVVPPGRCDRSPCGTGSSARLALLHARGEMQVGETLIHESITGSRFACTIDDTCQVGNYPAVIPAIAGQAWITGFYQMGMEPTDPWQDGFTLADVWQRTL